MDTTMEGSLSLSSPLLVPETSDSSSHMAIEVPNCANGNHLNDSHHFRSMKPEVTVDPFRNSTPHIEGIYEVSKMIICVPIAAVRLLLFGICIVVGYIATFLALLKWKDTFNPLPRWRSHLMLITRLCGRVILFAFGYHWIRRKGKPAPREIAPIVVSNHLSYIEPIFFFYDLFPTIVSSESHDSLPVVGAIIRAMQVIYVNRFSSSSRKLAVNEIKRVASSNGFRRVLLFPEGTTSNGKVLLTFKLGAFIPGCPIQPVVVRYPFVHFDQTWGNVSLMRLMIRMFLQFHNFMEVEYLPVIYPSNKCIESPSSFAARVRNAISSSLNVVQTFYSFGDIMLLQKAAEAKHSNPSSFLLEMSKVESLFNIPIAEALLLLDKYLLMKPDSSGRVKYNEFSVVLGLPLCAVSEKIFSFVDVENAGTITFKQFVYASGHLTQQPLFWQLCDAVFNLSSNQGLREFTQQAFTDAIVNTEDMQGSEISNLFKVVFDSEGRRGISRDGFVSSMRKNPWSIALFVPSSDWLSLVSKSQHNIADWRL